MNSPTNCSGACKVRAGSEIAFFKKSLLIVVPVLILVACGPSREQIDAKEAAISSYMEKEKALADSVSSYAPGIATETIGGIAHNFIRTAAMKFKVKDVLNSTRKIEQIAALAGGYVTNSDLTSNQDYMNTVHFKKDSVLEIRHFTSSSAIHLRIPNDRLDSVLSEITELAVKMDYRTIKANDVKLKLYANKLAENRYSEYKKRVQKKIDTKDAKLTQITDAEEKALEKQTLADSKSIESFDMIDQVNYSTVTLDLYQSQSVTSEIVALPPSVDPYEPAFTDKLKTSFLIGFDILKSVFLFFINVWGLFLILIALFIAVKKTIHYYTKKETVIGRSQN
jgi:hypothetical protein